MHRSNGYVPDSTAEDFEDRGRGPGGRTADATNGIKPMIMYPESCEPFPI